MKYFKNIETGAYWSETEIKKSCGDFGIDFEDFMDGDNNLIAAEDIKAEFTVEKDGEVIGEFEDAQSAIEFAVESGTSYVYEDDKEVEF